MKFPEEWIIDPLHHSSCFFDYELIYIFMVEEAVA